MGSNTGRSLANEMLQYTNKPGAAVPSLAFVTRQFASADAMGFNKASTVPDMMKDYELRSYDMRDLETTMVSKDVYLLTYTANQDADRWHVLYAWRHDGSLYTLSQHVAVPLTYRKVVADLDRMLRSLVLVRPS